MAAALLAALLGAAPAVAEPVFAESPWWRLSARPAPTYFKQGEEEAKIIVTATNLGNANTNGEITITDKLPPNLEATATSLHAELGDVNVEACEGLSSPTEPSCTWKETDPAINPYELLEFAITVRVKPGATSGEMNTATVVGGGAPETLPLTRPIRVAAPGEAVPFGVEKYELKPEEQGGLPDIQAGSSPFQLTTSLDFNQTLESYVNFGVSGLVPSAPALVRDLTFNLPPGLIGNVNGLQQCSDAEFVTIIPGSNSANACPAGTAVGVAGVTLNEPNNNPGQTRTVPVFNLAPGPGEPARFGFEVFRVPVVLNTAVLTGGNYGVAVSTTNTTELGQVLSTKVSFWGEPGNPAHDASRGWACVVGGKWNPNEAKSSCPLESRPTQPFLRLPTSCGPLETSVEGNSWPTRDAPSGLSLQQATPLAGDTTFQDTLAGCETLPFSSSISVIPETQAANTPTGMVVDVKVPQKSSLELGGRAEADVKDTTLALPQGVLLNPGAANGLLACSEAEIGLQSAQAISCPDESKVGLVHIESPFLQQVEEKEGKPVYEKLDGAVYLAAQNANPFGSLLALYIVAESPVSHVLVKLAGEVKLNEQTGQVVSTFKSTPQLPFEDLKVELFGGSRASVTTPPLCGQYTSTSSFASWSGKEEATSAEPFSITSGPGGAPCSNPQPFAPGFQAGTTNNQAGGFTPFTLTINRADSNQPVSSISMRLPSGLAAILASVTPCPEPQASQGTCGPDSLIGHATSSSGLGADPFTLGGQVYLTGPYNGAPFGISIVTPAVAGPFNFGNVIVRSSINVDPYTAAVTINSAIPTMLETAAVGKPGIPVQLQRTTVTVDRPNFQFNPTNCTPMKIDGTLGGAQGATAAVSSPFQVANCAALPFKPTFAASTQAKTSKGNGASLRVKVTSPGLGQANIAKTTVALPIALPSRLTTIQKACLASVFEANPASCPDGSNIGTATIHTPVFKNPLSGPAFLISHGNAAFPDIEFVLQGEGVTIILDGKTDIKKGITTSAFEALPDAPFTTFETVLPEGPHSALAANGNLCTQPLIMPTTITAQNGRVVKQSTKISVTGCPKKKALTRKQKLAKALKACRKKYKGKTNATKHKRVACEKKAKKKYGAKKKK